MLSGKYEVGVQTAVSELRQVHHCSTRAVTLENVPRHASSVLETKWTEQDRWLSARALA